jgi:hypothetical protein
VATRLELPNLRRLLGSTPGTRRFERDSRNPAHVARAHLERRALGVLLQNASDHPIVNFVEATRSWN